MDQNQSERKLSDLPPSESNYWDLAEKTASYIRGKPKCEHYFKYVNGTEVECIKCRVGFFITPSDSVLNGRIYHKGELVI